MAPVQSFFRLTQVPFGLSVSVNKMIFPSSVFMSFAFQRYMANTSPCFYFREILDSSESPFCSIRTHFSLSDLLQSHNHWWEHAQNLQTFTIFFVFPLLWQNTAFQLQPLPSSVLALPSLEQSASSYPSRRRGTTCWSQHPCSIPLQVQGSLLT